MSSKGTIAAALVAFGATGPLLAPAFLGSTLLLRRLGARTLLDVIPLDATLVKGSHGVAPRDPADGAMIASKQPDLIDSPRILPTAVRDLILRHVFD